MKAPRIAVSGLHRGENPQPGVGIVRSVRRRWPDAFIVGLAYDAQESGIYAEDGPDAAFVMPYPTAGAQPFISRLDDVIAKAPFDMFVPTLDAEIELLVHLEEELASRGIRTFLPGLDMLHKRSKDKLTDLAKRCGVAVPETVSAGDVGAALAAAARLEFPLMVKGQYYDAKMVHSYDELSAATSKLLSQWGAPLILQRCIKGPEFNSLGIGDGKGAIIGLCSIRKTIISDKGKGLGGMTIKDAKLELFCEKLISELQWRGPFEVEVMKDDETGEYVLIEINPRFPAWVDFPSMFGANFPAAVVELIASGVCAPLPKCAAGHFYLRHQVEVLGHVSQLSSLSSEGAVMLRAATG